MRVRLILQPFDHDLSLHEVLTAALASEELDELLVVTAWAKESGLRRLRSALQQFKGRGGRTQIVVGVDEGGATVQGLEAAIADFDKAQVVFDQGSGTFHPKIYCISGSTTATVVVGSSNLTAGGLYRNYEASAVLDLDLSDQSDAAIVQRVRDYVAEIEGDGTSIELNLESLRTLLDSSYFRITTEGSRGGRRDTDEEALGVREAAGGAAPSVFGRSRYPKKADPLVGESRSRPGSPGGAAAGALGATKEIAGASEQGGSDADLRLRWTKQLTRSDCGQPRAGSKTTGALRFTQARHPIDSATWFRDNLFIDADWSADETLPGREIADVRFEVRIGGVERGTHPLRLKYDGRREAGQHNFTTDLKWGPLTQIIRSEDLTNQWIAVERLADGTMRIEITPDEPSAIIA